MMYDDDDNDDTVDDAAADLVSESKARVLK